jgi:RNA polymerase sigma-70 factor (ECF subfamily)
MHASDEDLPLVRAARKGEFAAFEALVGKYERQIFTLSLRILAQRQDAEEVVQQTFLTVVERLDSFREEARFSTWLMRVATNHALALLRKRKLRSTVPLTDDATADRYEDLPHPQFIAQWRETPDQIASQREVRRLLDEALGELNEKHRLVFVLRDLEGLSTLETAQALGISEANVKVRLLRARLALRERLTRAFGDEQTQVTPDHNHDS